MESAHHDVSIERVPPPAARQEELSVVRQLHCGTFARGIIAGLGGDYVQHYYEAIVDSPSGVLFIARKDGRIVGFLAGTTNRDEFEQTTRLRGTKPRILRRVVTLRLSPVAIIRAIRKRRLIAGCTDRAELISIAVSDEARRRGIGLELLSAWIQSLRQQQIDSFIVFTDNPEGFKFYRKCGAQLLFAFRLGRQTSAAFRLRVR
jgi:ribosomal protein S18 acetylase RimI-like enzyme